MQAFQTTRRSILMLMSGIWAANPTAHAGPASASNAHAYSDGRSSARLRMDAKDQGVILKHGDGPGQCDIYGAREALIFKENDIYHLFYDGAGPPGWRACLATSKDLKTWEKKGPILELGDAGEDDSAAACAPWVHFDGKEWHIFYLGTPKASVFVHQPHRNRRRRIYRRHLGLLDEGLEPLEPR